MTTITKLLILTCLLTCLLPREARHLRKHPPTSVRRGGGGGRGGGAGGKRPSSNRPRPPHGGNRGGDDNDYDDDDNKKQCFPASSVVHLSPRSVIPMSELRIGHSVLMADRTNSEVFAFSHRDQDTTAWFTRLVTSLGNLTVTSGHYIYTASMENEAASVTAAGKVPKGHFLVRGEGKDRARIWNVVQVREKGLYNPHTMSNELIVDGFRVSTFTKSVKPYVANSLLAPLRALYKVTRRDWFSHHLDLGCPAVLKPMLHSMQLLSG